jgi:hypothetical protein
LPLTTPLVKHERGNLKLPATVGLTFGATGVTVLLVESVCHFNNRPAIKALLGRDGLPKHG